MIVILMMMMRSGKRCEVMKCRGFLQIPPMLLRTSQATRPYRSLIDIGAGDEHGRTVLHVASASGYEEAVDWALRCGADLRHVAADGRTALHYAAYMGQPRCVEMLLAVGSNPAARSLSASVWLEPIASLKSASCCAMRT